MNNVSPYSTKSTEDLIKAFEEDGYNVNPIVNFEGRRGIKALSKTATNYQTQEPKNVLYVEGNAYEMGYLIGRMAYKDVERMCTEYLDNIIPAFIDPNLDPYKYKILLEVLSYIVMEYCVHIYKKHPDDIPQVLRDEMKGIEDGCKASDPHTKVTYDRLFALNAGVDCLLAFIYPGDGLLEILAELDLRIEELMLRIPGLKVGPSGLKSIFPSFKPEHFRLPISCNAFSVFGEAAEGKHYFGRDFMFPPADVFQDTACLIIYNPKYKNNKRALPFISMAAPGFVGCIAAMNIEGIGIGIDMAPSVLCDHKRPGLNALLLARYSIQNSSSAEEIIDTIIAAQRGVSWIYFVADGKNNKAAVVEAAKKTDKIDYLHYPPENLKKYLPKGPFNKSQQGLMVRWNGYNYPASYLKYNKKLFDYFNKKYNSADFQKCGYIDKTWTDKNLPESFYFAPQRENRPYVLIVTNRWLVPEMQLCAMDPWTVVLAGSHLNDIQWRYDELNNEILNALGECRKLGTGIDWDTAKKLINFLAPDGKFPDYYKNNKKSSDGKTKMINGSVSLCNLTDKIITSHFGYYADDWIKIHLPNYVS